jgi:hypothetical protein
MSVDVIREWVKTNDFFEGGRDISDRQNTYVSSRNVYPHVHIGSNFITYSKGPNNHSYLIEAGGVVRKGRIDTALADAPQADVFMNQVLRYMSSQL